MSLLINVNPTRFRIAALRTIARDRECVPLTIKPASVSRSIYLWIFQTSESSRARRPNLDPRRTLRTLNRKKAKPNPIRDWSPVVSSSYCRCNACYSSLSQRLQQSTVNHNGRLSTFGQRDSKVSTTLGPDTGAIRFYAPRVYLATWDTWVWVYLCVGPFLGRRARVLWSPGWGTRTHTFTGIRAARDSSTLWQRELSFSPDDTDTSWLRDVASVSERRKRNAIFYTEAQPTEIDGKISFFFFLHKISRTCLSR